MELVNFIFCLTALDEYDPVARRGNVDLTGFFGVGKGARKAGKPKKKTTTPTGRTGPSGRTRPAPQSKIAAGVGGGNKANAELKQKYKVLQSQMNAVREILNMEEDPSLLV